MRLTPLAVLIPACFLILSSMALLCWLTMIDVDDLQARLPNSGLSRTTAVAETRPLIGTFVAGPGRPAELPGAWPQFRGEHSDGIAHDTVPLARSWPSGTPVVLWSIELGEGYAGAAVRDGRVYVLDYDEKKKADALRCLSLADGQEIWRYSYPVAVKRNHGMSRTIPAVSDKYVVALGPKCHIMCLDAKTGECYWLKDLVREFGATVPLWYAGQCPLIDGERAIFAPGGDALMIALDCRSGKLVWQSPNPSGWKMTHSSIMPMEFAGQKMFVYCGKGGMAGVSAEDGTRLWDTTAWGQIQITCPSPTILTEGRLFCAAGYESGSVMLQLEEKDGRITAHERFRLGPRQFGSTQQTPIFHEDYLYGVRDRERHENLVCLDLDGNEIWNSGPDATFGLGPYLVADGLLFVLDDSGLLTLAEATPSGYKPLAQAQVLEGHDAWAPMALVAGRLLLRDFTRMVCLDVAESLPAAGPMIDDRKGP
ncbi:MAG: PQQ-like beta-propeller repeat protein [Pirellulales bacterium]|nr:PQQ-like beta-propeller repeat protein [Pirellulales bacterium]